MKPKADNYQIITDAILEALDRGVVPWRKPWVVDGLAPTSLATGKAYRGINAFLLGLQDRPSPYWLTYKQAKKLGGCVRKGEKGSSVVFWKWLEKEEKDGRKKTFPIMRRFVVFNASQVDGLPEGAIPEPPEMPDNFDPIAEGDSILDGYFEREKGLSVATGGGSAYYVPSRDHIQLPNPSAFLGTAEYYSTAFHEAAHSTGAAHRLNRKAFQSVNRFGSHEYSQEELVAEMSAAFLMGSAGIASDEAFENSVAYIAGWRKKISEDKKLVITAAQQAQKAADRITGIEPTRKGEQS